MFILLLWKFYIFIFQVKGDNYRRKENGEFIFEVGCDLFSNTGKLNIYKLIEKWWLIKQIKQMETSSSLVVCTSSSCLM